MGLQVRETQGQQLWLEQEDIYHGSLILVNAKHAYREQTGKKRYLDETLQPVVKQQREDWRHLVLKETEDSEKMDLTAEIMAMKLQRRAVILLNELMADMHGWEQIVPVSAWRSHAEQQDIWDTSMRDSGREFTETYVAVPGHSEHETGLAIDLGLKLDVIDFIRPEFPYEGICQTFRKLAPRYGFVERYPKGKEAVTGIGQEPWHFRYVGKEAAAFMEEYDLCLEEFSDMVEFFHRPDESE